MSLGNAIVFSRGIRFTESNEDCPNCHNVKLNIDHMYLEGTKYMCPRCNYIEVKKEDKK